MSRSEVQIEPTSSLRYGRTTVAATATRIITSTDPFTRAVALKAASTNSEAIYIGDSSVSTATGFPLAAGEAVTLDVNNRESILYAISASGGQSVAWIVLS